jgi:hypothetical protein
MKRQNSTKRRRTSNARRILGGGKSKSQSLSRSAYKSSSHSSLKHPLSGRFKSTSFIPKAGVKRHLKGFKPLPGIDEEPPVSKKQIMSFGMDLLPSPEFDLLTLAKDITNLNISYVVDGRQYTENYWKSLSKKFVDIEAFKTKCSAVLHSISMRCSEEISSINDQLAHRNNQKETLLEKKPETPAGRLSKERQLKIYDTEIDKLKKRKSKLETLMNNTYQIPHQNPGENNQRRYIGQILGFVGRLEA